ncbi:MAG: peptide MFS transporter [Deltaproteobacteria bacterium]|nr:peptide MFS transporter [Deltaproteobacteria bacterium]
MARDRDSAFFGHPLGLATLFFTEMWERFSYYGMRAFLLLFIIAPVAEGGRGMSPITAGSVMAVFGASVYLLSLPGGWIADRFIGQRKAVTIGGIGIALGNGMLAYPDERLFYPGLALIAAGTGLLKPNVSTIVGQLYKPDDIRRDSGFTIYYMGINIGATAAPLVCGFLAQSTTFRNFLLEKEIDPNMCWKFAFGAAAVGMVGGLIQYTLGQSWLGEAGKKPTIPSDPARAARDRMVLGIVAGALAGIFALVVVFEPSKDVIVNVMGIGLVLGSIALFVGLYMSAHDAREKRGIIAMIPLFLGAIGFFGIFEQAPTTLSIYAEDLTRREFLGLTIPASYYQSVNGFFIVLLAPAFAYLWVRLARAKKEPSSVAKFAIGMVVLAFSFVIMLPATDASKLGTDPGPVSAGFLIGLYFFYTIAELCISPVGLSSMSKLAPKRLAGMVMGTWFLGTAIGIYLAGRATTISENNGFGFLFVFLIIASLVMAAALFVVAPIIKRMRAADDAAGPAMSEAPAVVDLPPARIVKDD